MHPTSSSETTYPFMTPVYHRIYRVSIHRICRTAWQTQRLYLHDAITEKELDIRGTEHLKTHRGSDTTNSELYTTDILRNALHVNTEKFSTARPTHIKRACGIASQTLLLYMYDAVLRRRLTSRRRCRSDRPCCRCSGPDSRRWYSAPPPWARPRPRSRSGASPWCHRRT